MPCSRPALINTHPEDFESWELLVGPLRASGVL